MCRVNLAAGEQFDRYVVGSKLGSGAMGAVYEARDLAEHREVALKVVHRRSNSDLRAEAGRHRLQREAEALMRLNHPNVVTLYNMGEHNGGMFLAMELVRGRTLTQWLAEDRPGWRALTKVFEQAGRGLQAVHDADLVHRDFKPDNVVLGEDGTVRVMDFGLARATVTSCDGFPTEQLAGVQSLEDPTGDHPLFDALSIQVTDAGTVVGTPAYMAPEQLFGLPIDDRSDQFAFCVAFYEALYGQQPFAWDSVDDLSAALADGNIQDVPTNTNVPSWIHQIVIRGLSIDPDQRFSSMGALLDALHQGRRRGRWWKRWQWWVGGAVSLAGAAALLGFR